MALPAIIDAARPPSKLASFRPFFFFGGDRAGREIIGMMTRNFLWRQQKASKVIIFGIVGGSGNRPLTRSRSAAGKTPSLPEIVRAPPSDIVARIFDSGLRGFSKGAILPVKMIGGEWP